MQHNLPEIAGLYKFNYPLKNISFFKVGGNCDVLFVPKDENDLIHFFKHKPDHLNVAVLGNISNTLISDKGYNGCIVRLDHLKNIEFFEGYLIAQAGIKLGELINECATRNLSCCEELTCIPGTLGGALFMNAGVPSFEVSDALISIDVLDFYGNKKTMLKEDLKPEYRNGNIPKDTIIISAKLKTSSKPLENILEHIKAIREKRNKSQPIGALTCGSTFKNPEKMKAWQLIKESNCDNLSIGGAKISDIHCNFLINTGNASAEDFFSLINLIKQRVFDKTGVLLEEEIIRLGEF